MKMLVSLALAIGALSTILVGCSAPEEGKRKQVSNYEAPPAVAEAPAAKPEPFFQEIFQKDSDGRTVRCFYKEAWYASYGGGPTMSCDWAGAIVHK